MVKKIRVVFILLVVITLTWFGWQSLVKKESDMVFSGWLEGETYRVMAESSGKVEEIFVQAGQEVTKDEVLIKLDDRLAIIQLAQAEANVAYAMSLAGDVELGSRPEQIAQGKAQVIALEKSLHGAEESLKRAKQQRQSIEKLVLEGAVAPDQLDAAKTLEATAQSTVDNLLAQIQGAEAQLKLLQEGATDNSKSATLAQVSVAQQQAKMAKLQLEKVTISSPVTGIVEEIFLNTGELANMGQTLMKVVDASKLSIMIYVPQSQLSQVMLNQEVIVRGENDSLKVGGKVTYIATQGEFTPKNIQTKEERATQVYAVKVELENAVEAGFKPGLAVEVKFD